MLLVDAKSEMDKVQSFSEIVKHLLLLTKTAESLSITLRIFGEDPITSCLFLRLLWKFSDGMPNPLKSEFIYYCRIIQNSLTIALPSLSSLLSEILSNEGKVQKSVVEIKPKAERLTELLLGNTDQSSQNIGQLIDSLVTAEPELISLRSESQMLKLLFGKKTKTHGWQDGSDAETCRPYLLTLLTHRASWGRLQSCVDHLLSKFEKNYSASAVLDFMEALTRNPRLWQGREKHIPKHHTPESVLHLSKDQVNLN